MDVMEQQSPDGDGRELVAGRFRVLGTIGQGGMGRVLRAEDSVLRRVVALKEIALPRGLPAAERTRLLDRVRREARLAGQLNHPGIVRVHDIVEHGGDPVIVMEYLDGRSLGAVLREDGPLPPDRVARIAAEVVAALDFAHAAGVVHRDLKPDNIVLTRDGRPVLTDFGIARTLGTDGTPLTAPGTLLGTPAFMAPEQIEGRELTPASDLWSLGATLYAALEGRSPFGGDSITDICVGIVTRPVPAPRNAGVLTPLLDGLLTKDPARRATGPQVLGFLDDLRRQLSQPTISGKDPWETLPDAEVRVPAISGYRAPVLGIIGTGVLWAGSMALPLWRWPLYSGSDSLSGWDLLTGGTSSTDTEWWLPAVATLLVAALAAVTLKPSLARFRAAVCWAAVPVGVVGAAILLVLGVPGNQTHVTHCVAEQNPYHLSVDEIDACIRAGEFGVGFFVGMVALVLLAGCGAWAVLSRRAPRASGPASRLG
ncbi:MAG TPA: serine/threonine-protein kinase [Actinospica sp.]|jgi:serine/threonine protein kinase|nr:serine/threonine-protein kinase [Actinospica sp.]